MNDADISVGECKFSYVRLIRVSINCDLLFQLENLMPKFGKECLKE